MPLFVVLLDSALCDAIENTPSKVGPFLGVGNCDIGNLLPTLIRHTSDQLQHFEFGKCAGSSVDEIEKCKQPASSERVLPSVCCQCRFVTTAQCFMAECSKVVSRGMHGFFAIKCHVDPKIQRVGTPDH